MLELEIIPQQQLKMASSLNDYKDLDLYLYWLSKEGYLEGRYFTCRCGHFNICHKNRKGKCLVKNCSLCCFIFLEMPINFNINLIKNPLSLNGFEEFLQNNLIIIPKRGTKIFWKMWERYLKVFN